MPIVAGLVAALSRFTGKVLTTTLGWTSTLLFGRVSADRQLIVLAITFGSVLWAILLLGVLLPDVGLFLQTFVPRQPLVDDDTLRLGMVVAAIVLPAAMGGLLVAMLPAPERTIPVALESMLRGYPLTALLAVLLVFLAGLAVWRKVRSLTRGWSDSHVPLIVLPGAYDRVAADLAAALAEAGFTVRSRPAPRMMTTPARWLAAVGGRASASLVPDELVLLHGPELEVLVYPMDLLISGHERSVARARSALASRLATTAAHLTVHPDAQELEDRLRSVMQADPAESLAALDAIDERLQALAIPYEEWETLYRLRLQAEVELRRRVAAGVDAHGAQVTKATARVVAVVAGLAAEIADVESSVSGRAPGTFRVLLTTIGRGFLDAVIGFRPVRARRRGGDERP